MVTSKSEIVAASAPAPKLSPAITEDNREEFVLAVIEGYVNSTVFTDYPSLPVDMFRDEEMWEPYEGAFNIFLWGAKREYYQYEFPGRTEETEAMEDGFRDNLADHWYEYEEIFLDDLKTTLSFYKLFYVELIMDDFDSDGATWKVEDCENPPIQEVW